MNKLQRNRLALRSAFFALFVLAPPLDLFRLDLNVGHFYFLRQNWTLGLEAFQRGEISPNQAIINLLVFGFIPIALVIGTGVWVAWKYGRLYCGWLCPHFSVVEMINALMRRATGKPSLWERRPLPEELPDGRIIRPDGRYWFMVALAVVGFAFVWSISFVTYLYTPSQIYSGLLTGELSTMQVALLIMFTVVFSLEFTLARHLFCRFGCAVGLFQSVAWMANKRAMVVGFKRERVNECLACNNACDNACPMRLKPRAIKRQMFTCTQCGQCIQACTQIEEGRGSLLNWVQDIEALDVSDREFGHGPDKSKSSQLCDAKADTAPVTGAGTAQAHRTTGT